MSASVRAAVAMGAAQARFLALTMRAIHGPAPFDQVAFAARHREIMADLRADVAGKPTPTRPTRSPASSPSPSA